MPYITERWPGGMLTNFVTIRKAVKKMAAIDRMKKDGTFETLSKKEKLQVDRLRAKLEKKCHLFAIGKIITICFLLFFFFWCTLGLSHLRTEIYFEVR